MQKEPEVKQPSVEEQREYLSLYDNTPTVVSVLGTKKKYKIYWIKNVQIEYLTRLLIRKGDTDDKDVEKDAFDKILEDTKIGCKAAAISVLNGYWKLKFYYWFLWRWMYYIRQYDNAQLQPLLEEMKKKIPLTQFLMLTMCLTGVKGSLMSMRTEEVERIVHEHVSVQEAQTEKSDNG